MICYNDMKPPEISVQKHSVYFVKWIFGFLSQGNICLMHAV